MLKMQTLISHQHRNIISDILAIARKKVKRRGRNLSDLRFAKRTTKGYAFFEVTHEVWDMLSEIVKEVLSKHPKYELAFVVELCSEVVNMDENEIRSLELAI